MAIGRDRRARLSAGVAARGHLRERSPAGEPKDSVSQAEADKVGLMDGAVRGSALYRHGVERSRESLAYERGPHTRLAGRFGQR
jgi:hypothetical protein